MKHLYKIILLYFGFAAFAHAKPLDKIIESETNNIFAEQRADFQEGNALIRKSIVELIGIRNEDFETPEYILVSGCRPNSCTEKASVMFNRAGTHILGVGILHFNCHFLLREKEIGEDNVRLQEVRPPQKCDKDPTLTVYVIRNKKNKIGELPERKVLAAIEGWAREFNFTKKDVRIWDRN
ncbi:hypothetical protein [Duganella sp. BuS-21]|uniref:hypothetical protein n=1 Tax=Duganella sp. BuS-21 TaxID=2943848 RepID=UPI0035A6A52F